LTRRNEACLISPRGRIAQSVEQWTENPRVGGSIPPLTTTAQHYPQKAGIMSSATDRNRAPIHQHLKQWLSGHEHILEVGSGDGEHALYFSRHFPQQQWQCSERREHLATLTNTLAQNTLPPPIELDVTHYAWGQQQYDVIFTANTLHIMSLQETEHFLHHLHLALKAHGQFIVYGPFNYQQQYTSISNRHFDHMLRNRQSGSCIKSFETLETILTQHQLQLDDDVAMPANNQLLRWRYKKA
jgi:cyclopropane fatty-acyl-phospholipid synthase-like methyltransferase